jgi:hypothetical protein
MQQGTNMENTQTQPSMQTPSSKLPSLQQHPTPLSLPPSPDTTQNIFLNDPTARLSSSPATSPRIVEPSPARRGSVYPAMSHTMEKGLEPGADFFDDGSSDSDWEDTEGNFTQTFSEGSGLRSLIHGVASNNEGSSRGRSRERNVLTALPPFRQLPAQRSEFGLTRDDQPSPSPFGKRGTKRAKEMSVRKLSRDSVRLVHTRSNAGTPRGSLRSNASSGSIQFTELPKLLPTKTNLSIELPWSDRYKGRHRSNTSDSIIAGSIIDAHVMTMRALESLNDSPSGVLTRTNSQTFSPSSAATSFPRFSSFSNNRHVTLSPLSTKGTENNNRDRPAHLPSYFIKTPYPFTTKKEFPKPKSRPRQRPGADHDRLDSGYDDDDGQKEYDDRKGKHVLGLMASEGDYDLRSRLERNEDAQGIIRSRAGSGRECGDSTVWLSLQRRAYMQGYHDRQAQKLASVTVPSNLTVSSPIQEKKSHGSELTVDFDDKFLAERLQDGYQTLAGSWFRRAFSARKLKDIRLSSVNTWSGNPSRPSSQTASGLLAAGTGIDVDSDTKSPFTENSLMYLYHHPTSGKARYTWVHWAQRVAASNSTRSSVSLRRRARSLDNNPFRFPQPVELAAETFLPDRITTIQFVNALSALRILTVLALMLAVSVSTALLWICLGSAGTGFRQGAERQRSDRVGSGMAVGILVLLLEGCGFGGWVWCS